MRALLKKAVFAALAIASALAIAEVVLSLTMSRAAPGEERLFRLNPLANESLYLYDPLLFWRLRPGATDGEVRINAAGMRGRRAKKKKPQGTLRVMLIGDSVPYGFKLKDEETIGSRLEEMLRETKKTQVINAGVVGYSSFQTRNYFQTALREYHPDFLVVYVGENDWSEAVHRADKDQPGVNPLVGQSWNRLRKLALFRGLRRLLRAAPPIPPLPRSGKDLSRVTPEDYAANLRAIDRQSREIGTVAFFCRVMHLGDPPCIGEGLYPIPDDLRIIDTLSFSRGLCLPEAGAYLRDAVHPTPAGAKLIAQAIARALQTRD